MNMLDCSLLDVIVVDSAAGILAGNDQSCAAAISCMHEGLPQHAAQVIHSRSRRILLMPQL